VLAGVTASLAPVLLKYLTFDAPSDDPASRSSLDKLTSDLGRLASDVNALKADRTTLGVDSSLAVDELRASLTAELVAELEVRLSKESLQKSRTSAIRRRFLLSHRRLIKEINSLGRRGNVNLVIGVITTLFAVGLLAYLVLNAPPFTSVASVLSHYIPRLSTVIFIEIFSFFFLRLYRSTLIEIKYYQNELTTLALLQIALEGSMLTPDAGVVAKVVEQFAQVNRNGLVMPTASDKSGPDYKAALEVLQSLGKFAAEASKSAKG
jgi:hypothetical protein